MDPQAPIRDSRHRIVHTATRLTWSQWRDLSRASAWILGTRAALSVLSWKRVSNAFSQTHRPVGPLNLSRAKQTVWAVDAVAKRILGDKPCLTQALVARHLLRDYGVETDLLLGAARKETGEIEAHAWLEREGIVVIGGATSPQKYITFQTSDAKVLDADITMR